MRSGKEGKFTVTNIRKDRNDRRQQNEHRNSGIGRLQIYLKLLYYPYCNNLHNNAVIHFNVVTRQKMNADK